MSMRITCSVALFAIIVLTPRAECQTPAELVKKAIEATGGAELLKKYPAGKAVGKGTIEIMGQSVEFTGETTHQVPDKTRMVMTLDLGGMKITVDQICNGKKYKRTVNDMAIPISDAVKEDMKETAYLEVLMQLTPLQDAKTYKLEKIEKPEAGYGDEVNGVLVKADGHRDVSLFFSKKTNLLIGIEHHGLGPEEKEVVEVNKLSGFKKIDGIMRAMKIEILHDGKPLMTSETTEYKNLEKVDPSEFDISD